jgi:hypothetical protein
MSDQQNVTASYYITESVKVEIEHWAREHDRSASWLVDKILSEWLAANNQPPTPRKRGTGPLRGEGA